MKKPIFFILLVFCFFPQFSQTFTGFYFSFLNHSKSFHYSNSEMFHAYPNYQKNYLNLFICIYKESNFETCLSLSSSKFISDSNYISRVGFAFEFGKLFSLSFSSRGKPILSPDIAAGAFVKFDLITPPLESTKKLFTSFGLYFSAKLKMVFTRMPLNIKSIDVGYRYRLPFSFNYFGSNFSILTYDYSFFFGISI